MRRVNLKAKVKKCHFGMSELLYLGFRVSARGVSPDNTKTEAVKRLEPPTNVKELRAFLGMASFYRMFVHNFAAKASPLTELLSSKTVWTWGPRQQEAFDPLKRNLTEAPTLAFPDFCRPFELHTDASTQGLGAVLVQREPDGTRHVVRYLSRALKPAEKRYSVAELECLAIVWATGKLRPHIEGRNFTVYTDHYGLKWLKTKKT